MKTLLFCSLIALGFTFNQKEQQESQYCAQLSNGKTTIVYQGKVITHSVSLDNGSVLKSDGTLMKKDGSKKMLENGECVGTSGKVISNKGPK